MHAFEPIPKWIVLALLIIGCGGSDETDDTVQFESVVSFGDSLSDVGTYEVGTIAELDGGQFTVNGAAPRVWTEFLSDSLDTPAQCAARTGMLPNDGTTGAPVTDFPECDNYAQGSARVTFSGTGPNGVGLQELGLINLGFLADSLRNQIDRHLAKIGGTYSGRELITVNAGANDLFVQLQAVVLAGDGGVDALGAALVAGWSQEVIAIVSAGGEAASAAATEAAIAAMGEAGAELVGYIEASMIDRGARYVLVRNLPNLNVTPFGRGFDQALQDLVTALSDAYNGALEAGLADVDGVLLFDDYAESTAIAEDPTAFGYTNVTIPSCGNNAFSNPPDSPAGPSIVCNATNLIDEDTSQFAFADDVHPTPYAHQKTAEAVLELMASVGWQ